MKITNRWLWFCGLLMLTVAAFAQTNGVVVVPDVPAPLPSNSAGYWELAIAGITPLLVTGIWWLVPKIPKLALPLITPAIGIGLGLLVNWLTTANLGWVDMAKAGALAVFIREVTNQAITKRMSAPEAPAPTP